MQQDWYLRQIISEGETGVDRAALDAALALGVACGGYCPRGRRAEDGEIPARYPLTETESPDHNEANRLNIKMADAVLLLYVRKPGMGSRHTLHMASDRKKPIITVDLADHPEAQDVADWLATMRGGITLMVAGSRESTIPGISESARRYLKELIALVPYHDTRAA
ncbi:MAG: YpsA SLOG family protein [Alphaproteobacteria bacterium]